MSQYLMDQMDPSSTQRRIDQATEAGRRAMDRALERSLEIDKAAAEENKRREQMIQDAKDESARKEAERVARRDAKEAEGEKKPQSPWAPREAKRTVLSFSDDEEAPAQQAPPPPPPRPVTPPAPAPRPAPSRRPAEAAAPDDDDDWSGRSWMRR